MQIRHNIQWQMPPPITRPFDHIRMLQWLIIIKPVKDRIILDLIQLHINRLQGLDLQNIIPIVNGRLLIIKRRELHPLKMPPIPLLLPHHNPHGSPLRNIHGLDHKGHLIDEGDGAGDVVEDLDVSDLLPGCGGVL